MTPEYAAQTQSLTPGTEIDLFILDLEPIGTDVQYYFTTTNEIGYTVKWGGQEYTYAPVSLTGVERSVNGDPPVPKVMLPNVNKFASALVVQYDDLVGAQITRYKTLKSFLDGEPLADTEAFSTKDLYTIEQKLNINKMFAEFAVRPLYALDGKMLPGRVCLKDICTHRYRLWNAETGTFNYAKATCPFANPLYFKRDGTPTTDASLDVCGKSLNDCTLRFGETAELPFRGFPGMSRTRLV